MRRDGSRWNGLLQGLATVVTGLILTTYSHAGDGTSIKPDNPAAPNPAPAQPTPVTAQAQGSADPMQLENRAIYSAAKRGAKWLESTQRPEGLFVYGWIPALNQPLKDDNLLRQAGAAAALARAAAATRDEQMALAARQAIIVLLSTYTEPDPDRPNEIRPTIRTIDQHPLGFASLILYAISEMPAPGDTLVRQGEMLARYLATRQQPDGSFSLKTGAIEEGAESNFGIDYYPGEALFALMRSYPNGSAKWKLDVVAKAYPYYHKYWKEEPNPAFIPWQTGAYAEAFILTKEKSYAEFVFEMNDWLLRLQFTNPQTAREEWMGGFGTYQYGRVLRTTPGITTASYLEALADAYRVAEMLEDKERMGAYRHSARLAIRFLTENQYTQRRLAHFQPDFAQKLNGAFHASVEDGIVRIDFAQHAVLGMFHYLNHVAEYKSPDEEKLAAPVKAPIAN